jgi:DNA-binding NtrC family response regulator
VVDDNQEMATTIADSLVDRGYEAVAVARGQDAVARLEAEPFDAVVTDLRMPGVDGLAVLSASRRLEPERPVIVMTAFSAIDTAVESIRQGAYHYLTKPFKTDELTIFLRRALDEHQLRLEATALRTTLEARGSSAHPIDLEFRGDVIPIREVQRRYATWALAQLGGHRGRTAHHLGVDGKTLAKWLSDNETGWR